MISSERLNGIRAFVQAADTGNFSQAAAQLGLSKSTVGKAIARLEGRLKVRLFHRTTRSLSLTDEGHAFYASCVRALSELEGAEAALVARQLAPTGRLRVSLPALFGMHWVMPVLLKLAERHPALEIETTFTNRRVDFAEEGIDLAVRIGELEAGASLTARRLGTQRLVLCATPSYFDKRGRPKSIEDLEHHACVGLLRDGRVAPWQFTNPSGSPFLLSIRSRLRFGHMEPVAAAVCAGYGIAQLPAWLVADAIATRKLEVASMSEESPSLPIHVIWPASRVIPPRSRATIDALLECFTPEAPWERR